VRLPFRAGRQACPGGRVAGEVRRRPTPYDY